MTGTNPSPESTDHVTDRLAAAGYTGRDFLFAAQVQNAIHAPPDAVLRMHTMHILSSALMLREVLQQSDKPADPDLLAAISGIVPLLRESADVFDGIVKAAQS